MYIVLLLSTLLLCFNTIKVVSTLAQAVNECSHDRTAGSRLFASADKALKGGIVPRRYDHRPENRQVPVISGHKLFAEQLYPGGFSRKRLLVTDPENQTKNTLGAEKPKQRLPRHPFQDVGLDADPLLAAKRGCQRDELSPCLRETLAFSCRLRFSPENDVDDSGGSLGKVNGMDNGWEIGAGAGQEKGNTSFHECSSAALCRQSLPGH